MNIRYAKIIEALTLLCAKRRPELVAGVWIKQRNGESTFAIETEINDGLIYAKGDRTGNWMMVPVDEVCGVEADFKKSKWFDDATTLPLIMAKLRKEAAEEHNKAA